MSHRITRLALGMALALVGPLTAGAERVEHEVRSKVLEQERTVTVQLPGSYAAESKQLFPVLFLLDGESNLDHAAAVTDYLAENGLIPEMIVVAVHAGATRGQDYLPPNATAGASGRADRFLQHLESELIPFVEKSYRAAPLRLLSGHSYGGVFVTYAMVERPDLFHAYLAQSPFLSGPIGDPLLARLDEKSAKGEAMAASFYANLGDEPNLEAGFVRLDSSLQSVSGAGVRLTERHAGKSHLATRLIGLYDGLERLFAGDWPVDPQRLAKGGVEALRKHVDGLSARYGFDVLVSEQTYQQATQLLLARQDPGAAAEAAGLYAQQYPRSPIAHFLLASALASAQQRARALTSVNEAIRLYEADPQPLLKPLHAGMQQLRGGLTKK